jgi:hypothetical protein
MEPRNYILQELKDLGSTLPQLSTPYEVPAGYFDQLPEWILKRIKALEAGNVKAETEALAPGLAAISRQMPYSLPANYFEQLDLGYVWADESSASKELETLSPLLAGLKKEAPYQVPADYFSNEVKAVPREEEGRAPVRRLFAQPLFRYAAAAILIAAIAVTAFPLLQKGKSIDPNEKSYAWVEKNLKKVETEEINEFLELFPEDMAAQNNVTVSAEVKSLLQDVSDNEIRDFLKETGSLDQATDDDIILN